ncbi:MAG: carbohydrate ABC transporter permease [Anaerolineae bacterium]|nr:carbohydrate ABC transporter permease [Anaerolineae bacterium]
MSASTRRRHPRETAKSFSITGTTALLLFLFLSPFAFMVFTSLKTQEQISVIGGPIWPARPAVYEYDGKQVEMYTVPMNTCVGSEDDNSNNNLALIKKGLKESTFVDPDDPERGEFVCAVSWRSLSRPWQFAPTWDNYKRVWDTIDYPRLMWNTTMYAVLSTIGVLFSCTLVAYGFSRFDFPGRDFLFIVLIATIFLPAFVTLIPTYTFFQRIGWVGTWLPLIVPTFFGNAFDVFLLRQYFMTIPRELDEAAMMDGASRFRVLWSVILPQSYPALLAVTVFHIVYAWNDYFGPLIYLSTNRAAWPISVALSTFNGIYGSQPQLIQAGALMALIAPLILFILAQRFFVRGIVITGVEK